MITSLDKNNNIVISYETEKKQGPFKCPNCLKETILKKGKIKVHHFAHHKKCDCIRKPETELHMKTKINIYKKMKEIFKNKTYIEYNKFKNFIPDVYIDLNKPFAFEIQHTKITFKDIKARTQKYIDNNIYCYWIFNKEDIKFYGKSHIKLNSMQLYALKLYKNSIYVYDQEENKIEKWKLGRYFSYNEYYNDEGEFQSSSRYTKTIKTIIQIEEKWKN